MFKILLYADGSIYYVNISNVFNIVNIRKIDNSKYWQYPYN